MIAHREEDHRVAGWRRLQLVVQKPLVEDADVLGGEIGEVHGDHDPSAAAALTDPHLGPRQEVQHLVDVAVRQHVALRPETGALEHGEGSGESLRRVGSSRREQVAAVGRHRQVRVVGSVPHQPEERQHSRPGPESARQGAGPGRRPFELFQQAVEPVALVIEGVVPGQQFPRLGEQDHHEPHGHPAGGAIDVGGVHVPASLLQRFAVALNQEFDRFPDPFAQNFRKFRLSLAGVPNRLQQGRFGVFALGSPELGTQQSAERRHLRGDFAMLEPQFQVPFAPGVEIEPGEQEPPLPAVGHQCQVILAGAQPPQHLADGPAAPADAESLAAPVQEDGQPAAVGTGPELAWFDGLAGDGAASPRWVDVAASRPGARRRIQTADPFQNEGCE